MKIAYLDLNTDDFWEDYSINPKRYGGGRVFAAAAKEAWANFDIYANPRSFDNVATDWSENVQACKNLSWEERKAIREFKPIKDIIPYSEEYDLFVAHDLAFPVNLDGLKAKFCVWSVGYGGELNPGIKHLLYYNDYQQNKCEPDTKRYKVTIGKKIPEFQKYNKDDYIFQCTRHLDIFGSIEIAATCKKLGIKAYFAGPIENGYPLLDYIDNKNTHYLGLISEEIKNEFLKRARLCTFYHKWPTPFNLSAIEALSYGTPLAVTPVGFWESLLTPKNGFMISNENSFKAQYENAVSFSQQDCWESARPYSEEHMIHSFKKAFEEILS